MTVSLARPGAAGSRAGDGVPAGYGAVFAPRAHVVRPAAGPALPVPEVRA
ncbi:hypothetical protein ACWGIN_06580 [Streptomyces sp. NPDC054861]